MIQPNKYGGGVQAARFGTHEAQMLTQAQRAQLMMDMGMDMEEEYDDEYYDEEMDLEGIEMDPEEQIYAANYGGQQVMVNAQGVPV